MTLAATSSPAAPPPPEPDRGTTSAVPIVARITRIEIDVTLDPEAGSLHERTSLTVSGDGIRSLTFRIDGGLVAERSSASAGVIEHRQAGDNLHVDVDPPIEGSRTLSFVVTGRPRRGETPLITPRAAVLGAFDGWYPSLDRTWAEASVTIRVPEGWSAIAPGEPVPSTPAGTFSWRARKPLRTLAVAAGPGLAVTTSKILAIPLRVAAPESGFGARDLAERLKDSMVWLSSALAPYPFDGVNVVLLPNAPGRARAGGLVVVPADVPIETPSDGADLLAGQWFGERVAGDGRWIEAFAAWQGAMFARDRALPLPSEIVRLRDAYFDLLSGDVPLALATTATPDEVVRGKGSAVPDMIRLTIGDRSFFAALRSLFERPVELPLRLADLRAVFETYGERPLGRVFQDWFEGTGAPEIEASLRTFPAAGGDGWRVDLSLVQKRGTYALPVEVVFLGAGVERRETIEIDEVKTDLVYDLPFEPVRVVVDPEHRLFRRD